MSGIRREVLQAFKSLHRTRQYVFAGDNRSLESGRHEINNRFKRNMNETDPNNISKMLKLALDVEKELRSCVIQAEQKVEGVYELRINPETTRLNNVPYQKNAIDETKYKNKKYDTNQIKSFCCQQQPESIPEKTKV